MATAASYSTIPPNSYSGLGSQGDLFHAANYGSYDTGFGSLTSHPYQYQGNQPYPPSFPNGHQPTSHPPKKSEMNSNDHKETNNNGQTNKDQFQDRSVISDNGGKKQKKTEKQQISSSKTTEPSGTEHSTAKSKPSVLPPIGQGTPATGERAGRRNSNPTIDLRMNKSTAMRAAAIKQKEEALEQKRRDAYFPSNGKFNDDVQKKRRTNKESHSVPKQSKSRRKTRLTDDSASSNDEDDRTTVVARRRRARRHQDLPPLRRLPPPPFYDPYFDYHRRPYPFHDPYSAYPYPVRFDHHTRHFYEHPDYDSYDAVFDYDKNRARSKARMQRKKKEAHTDQEGETDYDDDIRKTRRPEEELVPPFDEPFYNENNALEVWRQNRNDYLKNKFKPTIHDVLYSQQWKKADSYLENQRRRALRESQGFYFPYKQYTLKDYKDLQKMESNKNPYAPLEDPLTDRKDRPKNYGQYDKPLGFVRSTRSKLPPMQQPEQQEQDKLSKRQRALEYAKVQVQRNQPPKERKAKVDPTEEYVNSLFPENYDEDENDDRENDVNQRHRKNRQPMAHVDDDDDEDDQ